MPAFAYFLFRDNGSLVLASFEKVVFVNNIVSKQ